MMISRMKNIPRRSTLPDVEELEAVSRYMEKQISKLHQPQRQEDDEVSTTISSTVSVGSPSKRFTGL